MKTLAYFFSAALLFCMAACVETDKSIGNVDPPLTQSVSEALPELVIEPEHPYTSVVRWWTTEILYCTGVSTREEAWKMSNDEKLAIIDKMSEEYSDLPEDAEINKILSSVYEYVVSVINKSLGLDFTDGDE